MRAGRASSARCGGGGWRRTPSFWARSSFRALVAVAAHAFLGLSGPRATGAFAGGETNTPALAAALETLKGRSGFDELVADPIVGYSLSYPLGVVMPLLVVWAVLRRERRRPGPRPPALFVHTVLVERATGTLDQLRERHGGSVSFGRLKREGELMAAAGTIEPQPGDLLSVVGTAEEVDLIERELGRRGSEEIELDRHDLDFRRIIISSRGVAGRRIADLHLEDRFGAAATRLRRGDVDLVAEPDIQLELGDAIRIVAPRTRMKEIATFFGDSYRALGEVDVLTFSAGIAAGLALGTVDFPLPGSSGSFSLGFAGGPLVAGLVLGATRPDRAVRLAVAVHGEPDPAPIRDGALPRRHRHALGACVRRRGDRAVGARRDRGGRGRDRVRAPDPARRRYADPAPARADVDRGARQACRPNPQCCAYASDQLDNERELTLGYASVYPVAIIAKIVIAQILAALTL